jgi:hypothetical protein
MQLKTNSLSPLTDIFYPNEFFVDLLEQLKRKQFLAVKCGVQDPIPTKVLGEKLRFSYMTVKLV